MKKHLYAALAAAALLAADCTPYNPSFADFLEDATNPENRKGFFEFDITILNTDLVLPNSFNSPFQVKLEADTNEQLQLGGPEGADWLEQNTAKTTLENLGTTKHVKSIKGAYKIEHGKYKLTLVLASPNEYYRDEFNFWLSPGEHYLLKRTFSSNNYTDGTAPPPTP